MRELTEVTRKLLIICCLFTAQHSGCPITYVKVRGLRGIQCKAESGNESGEGSNAFAEKLLLSLSMDNLRGRYS